MNKQEMANQMIARSAREMSYYAQAPVHFLDAWKDAVAIAGADLFTAERKYEKPAKLAETLSKWQLIPDLAAIQKYTGYCSVGEGVFVGALVCFYNGQLGEEILHLYGINGMGEVARRLDLEHVKILTRLMLHYTGW